MLAVGTKIVAASRCSNLQLGLRCASTAYKLIEVTKKENGVSEISMARKPVNGLNYELLSDLRKAFLEAENDGSKGVVLTSSLPTVFSAGLDIMEFYKVERSSAQRFWSMLQDTWLTLYGLGVPTAAAINGASPAGGCVFAMACEYRVMVDGKHTIGLNETKLGIAAPMWIMTSMVDTIGQRQAESALLKGTMFTSQEALKIGLIDDVATDKEQTLSKCHDYVTSFGKMSARARNAVKLAVRHERISWMKNNREKDNRDFIDFMEHPEVQTGLGLYIQSLKKKKS